MIAISIKFPVPDKLSNTFLKIIFGGLAIFRIIDRKLVITSKIISFKSLRNIIIEKITEDQNNKNETIFLLINDDNKFKDSSIIKIPDEKLFVKFELNSLYKYNISFTNMSCEGYFNFINLNRPNSNGIISINSIPDEIILLSYELYSQRYY